jgi:hypothetical protein
MPRMRLSFDRLWVWVALTLPALVSLLVPIAAVDLAYQVRAGEEILRTGVIPAVETWTFTVAGTPWTDQQWLAQVLLALGFRVGGWELLVVLRAALVSLSIGLLVATAMARGARARTASILGLLAFALAAPALALRPQLFAIAIFAAMLLLVARRQRNPRAIWLAPLLVIAWANIHGSFVLAPILLGYAWLDDLVRGRPARASFALLAAGTAATLVNPFGAAVWSYAAGIGANPVISGQVSEWQRTTPFTVPGLLFYLSGAAALALAVRGRAALRWPDWLWLAAMFAVGVWAVRGLAWWPFGAVFVLGGLPDALWPATRAMGARRPPRVPAVLAALLGVLVIAALPWWRPVDPITGRIGILSYAPSGIAAELQRIAPAGTRVLAAQTWASFLEWAVPDAQYFLDSRFELFPAEVWADRATIAAGGKAADEVLAQWGVDLLVLPAGTDLRLAGWTAVYEDADGMILRADGPAAT